VYREARSADVHFEQWSGANAILAPRNVAVNADKRESLNSDV
jgi:hypothetical protein